MNKDKIYQNKSDEKPFCFNKEVAKVFPDMLQRSIPGYAATIDAIRSLAARYVKAGTNCYDLGCSLGASTIAIRQGITAPKCKIVAVDNATAMIERCRNIIAEDDRQFSPETAVTIVENDIRDIEITNASMVVLNYTLQFIRKADRNPLMQSIHEGLNNDGLLIMSEKVVDENQEIEQLLVDLHHEHKHRNGYSKLEISRKRSSLENVLVPETIAAHQERLSKAGFNHYAVWQRHLNFASFIAIKK